MSTVLWQTLHCCITLHCVIAQHSTLGVDHVLTKYVSIRGEGVWNFWLRLRSCFDRIYSDFSDSEAFQSFGLRLLKLDGMSLEGSIADDAMQTDVHKTLYPFYTTKKMPNVTVTITKKNASLAAIGRYINITTIYTVGYLHIFNAGHFFSSKHCHH